MGQHPDSLSAATPGSHVGCKVPFFSAKRKKLYAHAMQNISLMGTLTPFSSVHRQEKVVPPRPERDWRGKGGGHRSFLPAGRCRNTVARVSPKKASVNSIEESRGEESRERLGTGHRKTDALPQEWERGARLVPGSRYQHIGHIVVPQSAKDHSSRNAAEGRHMRRLNSTVVPSRAKRNGNQMNGKKQGQPEGCPRLSFITPFAHERRKTHAAAWSSLRRGGSLVPLVSFHLRGMPMECESLIGKRKVQDKKKVAVDLKTSEDINSYVK